MRLSLSRFPLIVVLLLIGAPLVFAQASRNPGTTLPGQISGQVRYADDNQPAFNVLVSCDAFGGGLIGQVLTDRSGRFQFKGLAPEQYNISVRVQGYVEERQTVELMTSPSAYVSIQLRADKSNTARTNSLSPVVDVSVPAPAKKEFDQGVALIEKGKKAELQEGVRHLEKAVNIHPKFVQAQLKLGTAYMDLGEWDKADQALHKTLELDPKAANALFALGELYLQQKKEAEAEKVLVQGLTLEDRSYQGHLALARVYWNVAVKSSDDAQSRPKLEQAYDQVNQALKLNPDLAQAHLVKGNIYLKARRPQDALHEFEEYLRLDPKGPFAAQARDTTEKIKKALEGKK